MANYVVLVQWTEQGVQQVKDTIERSHQATAAFEPLGVRLRDIYWTSGRYDIVLLLEAPDDESLSAAMLKLGMMGNVRTETLRAFSEQEMRRILDKFG